MERNGFSYFSEFEQNEKFYISLIFRGFSFQKITVVALLMSQFCYNFCVKITLYNVCSVHRGDIMSTSGGHHEYIGGYYEYIGGTSWVHQGDIMSTSGGYHEYTGGVQYIGGISWVHQGMFSTSEGYHEYMRGISWVHRGGGGGGISWVHWECSVHRDFQ